MSVQEKIKEQINSNKILVYMKGNREFPQCGFSAAVVSIFQELDVPFETVDVLEDSEIREGVKNYSNWPTIPQIYVHGKFLGGCDIVREMHARGELKTLVKEAVKSA